jgi:Na+/melibiose symporter-like transporter
MSSSPIIQARTSTWRLIAYSLASIPLAMAALPIYVNVPKFYADVIGVSLTAIGGLLLAARVFDAVQDPLLGYWSDRTRHSKWGRFVWVIAGAPLLAAAMLGLFNPPILSTNLMMWWLVVMLLLVYTAFSMLQISYQAYGAEISDDPVERTRVVSFREGFGLIGVFLAAALPHMLSNQYGPREGYAIFAMIFIPFVLVMAALTVWLSPPPQTRVSTVSKGAFSNMLLPLKNTRFKSLLLVFVFNGIAASIPATLVLFFIEDVIKAPAQAAVFLIAYFAAGAAGMPLWVWLSARIGKGRAWLVGMLVSIVAFVWAFMLGAGDVVAFGIICVLSGLGLGADLALPPSILADVIDDDERAGHGRNEGSYFGLWNLVTKMNLALAAGIALPSLAMLGYVPQGNNSGQSLTYLAAIYALLPCMLKAIAAAALLYSPFARSVAKTGGAVPFAQRVNP